MFDGRRVEAVERLNKSLCRIGVGQSRGWMGLLNAKVRQHHRSKHTAEVRCRKLEHRLQDPFRSGAAIEFVHLDQQIQSVTIVARHATNRGELRINRDLPFDAGQDRLQFAVRKLEAERTRGFDQYAQGTCQVVRFLTIQVKHIDQLLVVQLLAEPWTWNAPTDKWLD